MLELLQSGQQNTMILPIKIYMVIIGSSATAFQQVKQKDDSTALVSATVSLDASQPGLSVSSTVQMLSAGSLFMQTRAGDCLRLIDKG